MKKLFLLVLIAQIINATAANIELQNNESNCKKVDGFESGADIAIARSQKVPVSSVRLIGTRWELSQYSTHKTCNALFDTATGPVRCNNYGIVSSDGGKTAFILIAPWGNAVCW